ncbi:MAG TPA: PA0069 family radical SAM protein [Gemmatimonadota bacterium]|nr:PA0069 family radical SAM protein [Gemmatimonadota bacterium]
MRPLPVRGRGAPGNPANRFEGLELEREGWTAEDPGPETRLLRDRSRSIITRNRSPDVGFDASVNPYRGCEHGCVYCLEGSTPILMSNGGTRPLEDLRPGDRIYGTRRRGWYRRLVVTTVLDHWRTRKPAWRVRLTDGTSLVASGDHRFLTDRGWKHVTGADQGRGRRPHLTRNNKLMGLGATLATPAATEDYRRGYLCGVIRGDGLLAAYDCDRPGRSHGRQRQFRLAMKDGEPLERTRTYLAEAGVPTHRFLFQKATASRAEMKASRTHARGNVEAIRRLVAFPADPPGEWFRGFLAGLFDAEGSQCAGLIRIVNSDATILEHLQRALDHFSFRYVDDRLQGRRTTGLRSIRLRGGIRQSLRFVQLTDPSILRKRDIRGAALRSAADLRVIDIEPLQGERELFDLTTETGDFIANGVVSHNCYARPTHEYLGFSAGLDFESRILAKEDAPRLLREELASPDWEPTVLAMSGVTDPYQPAERTLQITRGCLEVLAEARNPVAVITKSHLVTRDADHLAELASHGAARVALSVTTLDEDLRRVLEPRAATPSRRLDAVRTLSEAGIPAGVMIAPVIPGLTEHEIPSILEAAAEAGATHAAWIMLRLPHGVSEMFEAWLETHFPDRREKVLGRIREVRGGRLNDPRFGSRMRGRGPLADHISRLFHVSLRKAGLDGPRETLSTAAFRRPEPPPGSEGARAGEQLGLFG